MSDAVKDAPTDTRDTVRSLRIRRGYTQEDVEARAQGRLTPRTISKIDSGDMRVRLVSVDIYAKAIDEPTSAVVAGMEQERNLRKRAKASPFSLHRKGAR